MQVLALVPGGIDDQLAFFPILHQLKEKFDQAEISVVVNLAAKEVYQLTKAVKEVIPYNFQADNSPADWANLLGIIRDREFELVLTPTKSWSMGLLLWLSGVPTRVGYVAPANDLFLTDKVMPKAESSSSHAYGDLLQAVNIVDAPPALSVNVPQSDITAVERICQSARLDGGYVLIYPGSTASGDTFPTEGWISILKDFQQRQPELPLVVIQNSATADQVMGLTSALPGLKVITPETIGQTAALIAGANLLLAIDSYPLSLAAALNVYALGLFGQGAAPSVAPAEEQRLVAVVSPTGSLADISPEKVLKQIWSQET